MLGAFVVAYNVTHHLGLLPGGLGSAPAGTRWADWLDLLVPFLVLGTAGAALRAAGTDRQGWATALLGAVLYVQGHAVHLAANSISNARGAAEPVHLWDEIVGHLLWYGGCALVFSALARAFARVPLRSGVVPVVLALATGGTWTTNVLGADPLLLAGLLVAAVLTVQGWLSRTSAAGRLLIIAFAPSAVVLAAAAVVG